MPHRFLTFSTKRAILASSKAKALMDHGPSALFVFAARPIPLFGENRGLSERRPPAARVYGAWAFSFFFFFPFTRCRKQSSLRPQPPTGRGLFCWDGFLPRSLAFLPQVCYNLFSFILAKRERAPAPPRMRTNRGTTRRLREGCRRTDAARCKQPGAARPLPPRSAEANLCRVCPLQHIERRGPLGGAIRVEPWSVPGKE